LPTLWSGRFDGDVDERMRRLGDSLPVDVVLYREDIEASRAHVEMLARAGLLSPEERLAIDAALVTVETEFGTGAFRFEPGDEDIHTAVERRVTELTPAGARMHAGRSRNDQVSTDLRLWARGAGKGILTLISELQHALLDQALAAGTTMMPGYTHLQRAQPVAFGHQLLAHGWALNRDVDRLTDALARANVSPLGAGAIAGTSLDIDTEFTANLLGFDGVFENSIDAVGDRDFVAELLFVLALLGVHLSRLGEEMILWSTSEFGYVRFDDGFSTGSSMMPQKRNPDTAELARAKPGRLIGNLTAILVTLKGLPQGYSKDLQEDKELLFDSVETTERTLAALTGAIASAHFDLEIMSAAAADPVLGATALAELLVSGGIPFRQAHSKVADLVKRAENGEADLRSLVSEDPALGPEAARLLVDPAALEGSRGGGSAGALGNEIARFTRALEPSPEPGT
jgi:argininosuccinate lyase